MLAPKCKKAFSLDLKQTQKTVLQQRSSKMTSFVVPLKLSCWPPNIPSALPDFYQPDPLTEIDGVEKEDSATWGKCVVPNTEKEEKERTMKQSPKKKVLIHMDQFSHCLL